MNWLPKDKRAAVCFSIDDVHPGKATEYYDGGGDLASGALGHHLWLIERHPQLRTTLFVTADYRLIEHRPTRSFLASIPFLRDQFYLSRIRRKGEMRIDRHPNFVEFIKTLPGCSVALHGLNHCHRGLKLNQEYQNQSCSEMKSSLLEAIDIFRRAGLDFEPGLCPPGWSTPDNLLDAMIEVDLKYVAASRDLFSPVSSASLCALSGMRNVSMLYPQPLKDGKLLHIPANFSPSCPIDRAIQIIECGGVLSVKAHITKSALSWTAVDGLDDSYRNYLDELFQTIEKRFGSDIWWASMGEIARQYFDSKREIDNADRIYA